MLGLALFNLEKNFQKFLKEVTQVYQKRYFTQSLEEKVLSAQC
jgi:hypothetical protein